MRLDTNLFLLCSLYSLCLPSNQVCTKLYHQTLLMFLGDKDSLTLWRAGSLPLWSTGIILEDSSLKHTLSRDSWYFALATFESLIISMRAAT